MQTLDLDYAADGATLRGYLACEGGTARRPGVLVFHEGLGLGDFAMEKARQLASLGYVALAPRTRKCWPDKCFSPVFDTA